MPDTPFRALLGRIGMTQTEVARRWGIPLRTVQRWASGERPCLPWVINLIADAASRRKEIIMKAYRVKTEYIDRWTPEDVDELIVTEDEIRRLATEWDVAVGDLMEQVEEI